MNRTSIWNLISLVCLHVHVVLHSSHYMPSTLLCLLPVQIPLNDNWKDEFQKAYEGLGGLGERVLGFCDIILPAKEFPRGYNFSSEDVRRITYGLETIPWATHMYI